MLLGQCKAVVDMELAASHILLCGGSSGFKLAWQVWPQDIMHQPPEQRYL
jgi:hypothetical protein